MESATRSNGTSEIKSRCPVVSKRGVHYTSPFNDYIREKTRTEMSPASTDTHIQRTPKIRFVVTSRSMASVDTRIRVCCGSKQEHAERLTVSRLRI